MTVKKAIEALGGLTAAARQIGVPVTTVQWWRDHDRIPHWREHQLRAACEKNGIEAPGSNEDTQEK